jgi:hypothetical protein
MWSKMRVLLPVIWIVLTSPVVSSQGLSEEMKALEMGRMYSDSILQQLRADIRDWRYYDTDGHNEWTSTLRYLKERLTDRDFSDLFSSTISKFLFGEYSVEVAWNPTTYEQSRFVWIPVYPFLPSNEFRQATLASFRDMTERSFVELPQELSDFYRKLRLTPQALRDTVISITIAGDSLSLLFPSIARTEFYLISGASMIKTRIRALNFEFPAFGCEQIKAQFSDSLRDVIFAFPVVDTMTPPRIVDFDSASYSHLLGDSVEASAIPTPDQGPVFVGITHPAPISVDMLWDPKEKIVSHLKAAFGADWGNYEPYYEYNCLLCYGEEYFVLRIDSLCADLIVLKPHDFRVLTVADETAPEL